MNNKITIVLNTMDKIKKFNLIVSTYESDIDLTKGRYVIDAKSTIGIFTLNLFEPVNVIIHSPNEEEIIRFRQDMEEFKWEDH